MRHQIRTTIQPWKVIEVDDAELAELQAQGLVQDLLDETDSTPEIEAPVEEAMETDQELDAPENEGGQ